jgi:hypothetical protein
MSNKGKSVASIATIITAARAAKADSTKVETFQDGTTYVQYLVSGKEGDETTAVFTPTRRWPSLAKGNSVLVYKAMAGVIAATAQWEAAHNKGAFAFIGTAPEAQETPEAVKGFGRDDRIFEVQLTPTITELLATSASFDGEEHVSFFQGKTERRKAERKAYRTLSDPAVAAMVKLLREQD